jgi:mannose-6-phosphate isomerase
MILKFKPLLKTLVWGTENWVLSGVKGNETLVSEGPLAGKTLNEVYGGEFPLLIKFIDAKRDLSIQVHPDDALAAERHGCKGKTEMWYIIGASEGAHLISGFKKEITPEDYVRLLEEDGIVDVLADHKVAPGDVFHLPAGRIHAICGGCYLAEIQETSDITYRIYDYNRPGLDGKPRKLHTEEAKSAIDYKVYPSYRTEYSPALNSGVELVRDPHFITSLYELDSPVQVKMEDKGRFLAVICVEGFGYVDSQAISAGEAVLVLDQTAPISLKPSSKSSCKPSCSSESSSKPSCASKPSCCSNSPSASVKFLTTYL